MDISVVTPAHNEEQYLGRCIDSVKAAAEHASSCVEHIVVLNRCTDGTEVVATTNGCRIVHEDERNLSRIRNAGVAQARGKIIVTIDADSWMSTNMLTEVVHCLETGRFIGGGVRIFPERWSLGIICSTMIILPILLWQGVKSAGMFWCYKSDFDAIGGFDESLVCVEDIDFGRRLTSLGREKGLRYATIRKAHIMTSCRKFDQFGDWFFVRNPKFVYDIFHQSQQAADTLYYDFPHDLDDR